ncbi:hypothetical protein [Muricauda brasiliensis]|uniref:hypothetical protein n=1 Tax=Muricauda brasiliensis TaxID=2162892 RepID=UPI000D378675|nr:hypothetical protein [Muricauda brasiliensis]
MSFFKSKLNIWLLVSSLIAGLLSLWLYFKFTQHVGDISFDGTVDSSDFELCGDYRVLQYYQVGTYFQGGKKAIKEKLLPNVNADGLPSNGLLTIRFVVNCHGETGYFRAHMIDSNLSRVEVPKQGLEHFGTLITKLDGWVPGKIQDDPMDSYAQIVFKIENGTITDIF